jgi:SAM-dependent methyltransferase
VSEGKENKSVERLVDIGAGFGEFFIERAEADPSKGFIVIEPFGFPGEKLPANLLWLKARLGDKHFLPLQDASADEVNLNLTLSAIYADYQGSDQRFIGYLGKLLREALRVVKDGGQLVIREEQGFSEKLLGPSLDSLGITFEKSLASDEDLSWAGRESLADYRFDPEKNYHLQPLRITVLKKNG